MRTLTSEVFLGNLCNIQSQHLSEPHFGLGVPRYEEDNTNNQPLRGQQSVSSRKFNEVLRASAGAFFFCHLMLIYISTQSSLLTSNLSILK
jgi:hypothetical protein